MNRPREEKVAIIMAKHIVDKHNCKCKPIQMNGDGYLYLCNVIKSIEIKEYVLN